MTDVFISYSRRDKTFTQKLVEALQAANREVWADWASIPAASDWDAEIKYGLPPLSAEQPAGCSCGDVLQGAIRPPECPLFAGACTPDHPHGPCMVSSEGSCAAWYRYERSA